MNIIKQQDSSGIAGTLIVRSFPKGVISDLLKQGYSVAEAIAANAEKQLAEVQQHNLVVTAGKTLVGNLLTGKESTGITYIAIGTGTTAANVADTKLVAEVGRKEITDKIVSGATVTLSTFFLASECTFAITEIGFFGALATLAVNSGSLFSRILLTYNNSAGLYDLTFEYTLTIG